MSEFELGRSRDLSADLSELKEFIAHLDDDIVKMTCDKVALDAIIDRLTTKIAELIIKNHDLKLENYGYRRKARSNRNGGKD